VVIVMGEKQTDELLEEMMEDTLIYIRLFNRELMHLGERKFLKTFFWLILIEQYDNPSISVLGKKLRVSKSQMTSRIDELVKAGFIERVHDEKDRRIIKIALTPEGRNFIKESRKPVGEHMNQLLSPLNFKEVEKLSMSIEIIKNVVLKIQGLNE